MDEFIKVFKALTDENRVRILKMLERRPLCVCEIKSALNISTSTVSSHLSVLRGAGFIAAKKDGKWVEYKYNRTSKNPVLHQILAMFPGWLNEETSIKNDLENLKNADREEICARMT